MPLAYRVKNYLEPANNNKGATLESFDIKIFDVFIVDALAIITMNTLLLENGIKIIKTLYENSGSIKVSLR